MTVSVQIPTVGYIADGLLTNYPFTFGLIETADLVVSIDGVIQVEFSAYTVLKSTSAEDFQNGGSVEFTNPPAAAAIVIILRDTTISQQIDYTQAAFPSETHEFGYDKLTYILQELVNGAIDGSLTFDLSTVQGVETMTIVNSGGSDAILPAWESATFAGVFIGELTTTPPNDGDATTEPDGKVWFGV